MGAGRPNNSITPPWRSKPAIKVRMYHLLCFLKGVTPTIYGCAKMMQMSRTTATKLFAMMKWDMEKDEHYKAVRNWLLSHSQGGCPRTADDCAKDLKFDLDETRLDIEMLKIERKYIIY